MSSQNIGIILNQNSTKNQKLTKKYNIPKKSYTEDKDL